MVFQNLQIFSSRYPAFFYGLFFFLGCHFALISFWSLFPAILFLLFVEKKHVFSSALVFLIPLPLIFNQYDFLPNGSKIQGELFIQKISENARFSKGWSYQGILKTGENKKVRCQIFHPERFFANQIYQVEGILKERAKGFYFLKLKTLELSEKKHWTLAELRYKAKKKTKEYIKKNMMQERAAAFLSALATGELEDNSFANEFGRLGLSHIMAISGFHFGLVAFFFHFFLRLFCPYKISAGILLIILTLYFLFLGNCPSVFRAWVFSCVLLAGQILEKRSSSINSLGIASIVTLLFNPFSAATLSFQLSFLATAGILFFYAPVEKRLRVWLPKLSLQEVIKRNFLWQLGYLSLSFFRDAFSLILAVHLPLLPLLFFAFKAFPFNGLFYNLFFPFLTSISMLLFLIGCVLGKWVHWINGYFTEWILRIPESPPILFKTLYLTIPAWALTVYLTLLVILAVHIHTDKKNLFSSSRARARVRARARLFSKKSSKTSFHHKTGK